MLVIVVAEHHGFSPRESSGSATFDFLCPSGRKIGHMSFRPMPLDRITQPDYGNLRAFSQCELEVITKETYGECGSL